jgi:hypothetical protein
VIHLFGDYCETVVENRLMNGTDLMHYVSTFNLIADAITRFSGGAKAITHSGF